MKLSLALITLFAGLQVSASDLSKVQYDSWCQGERVMTADRDGQVFALWDCSEISDYSRCVEQAEKKAGVTTVTATCDSGRNQSFRKPMFCESYEDFEDCPQPEPGPDDEDDGDGGREGGGPDEPGGEF